MKVSALPVLVFLGLILLPGCDGGRVTELEAQVKTLTVERDQLKGDVETLEAEKEELEDKLLTLQSAVEDLRSKFEDLETSASGFQDGISNWRDVVPDVELDMDRVGSGLDDVEGELP